MRAILALVMMMTLLLPAAAQDDATPWQATVTAQIEAFRAKDGATALSFAGEGFRTQFEGQPEAFYAAIVAIGYQLSSTRARIALARSRWSARLS